ncbi:MAG: ROK family protein [Planctomycetota bacterium]|jgi:glucokinase|nr:ROK family protein [Planctomycetota bacterium]
MDVDSQAEASVLSFDVGGTQLRGALIDEAGRILEQMSVPTPRSSPEDLAQALTGVGDALVATESGRVSRPRAACVAMAGTVDRASGRVRSWPTTGFTDFDVTSALARRLDLPVSLVNDVNAAALGESEVSQCGELAALFLGTGVGTGFVSGGHLLEGERGMGGEGGHLPFRPGVRCPAGCDGCLEAYLGGDALERRSEAAGGPADVPEILKAWRAGQQPATAIMEEALEALEALVSITVNLLDPQRIVLGGGLGMRCPEMLARARQTVLELPLGNGRRDLPVEAARLGDEAGLIGAGRLARELLGG